MICVICGCNEATPGWETCGHCDAEEMRRMEEKQREKREYEEMMQREMEEELRRQEDP